MNASVLMVLIFIVAIAALVSTSAAVVWALVLLELVLCVLFVMATRQW